MRKVNLLLFGPSKIKKKVSYMFWKLASCDVTNTLKCLPPHTGVQFTLWNHLTDISGLKCLFKMSVWMINSQTVFRRSIFWILNHASLLHWSMEWEIKIWKWLYYGTNLKDSPSIQALGNLSHLPLIIGNVNVIVCFLCLTLSFVFFYWV